MNSALRGYGITECQAITCDFNSCANGGTCVTETTGYFCYCPLGYGGDTCAMSKELIYLNNC